MRHETPDEERPIERTDEHPAHQRQKYRRVEDRERVDSLSNISESIRNTPLTINKLVGLLTMFVALNQGINWWRSNNVTPESFKELSTQVGVLTKQVGELAESLKAKEAGDNFFYFSICVSWKQNVQGGSYPAFCDKPEIQQFDPLGRPVETPPPKRR